MKKNLFAILLCIFSINANCQWVELPETFGGDMIGTVKAIGNEIFVGTSSFGTTDKVYRSNDNGNTWIISNTGLGSASVHTFVTSGSIIYAGTYSEGVFKSVDGGFTWVNILDVPLSGYHSVTTINSVVIVGSSYGDVYRSADSGSTWSPVENDPCGYIYALHTGHNSVFAGHCSGVSVSKDDGLTWTMHDSGLVVSELNIFGTLDSLTYASDGDRVYKTADTGSYWQLITSNLDINAFKRCFATTTDKVIIGTQDGTFFTDNQGAFWTFADNGLWLEQVNAYDTLGNYIFAATNIGVFRIDTAAFTTASVSETDIPLTVKVFPNPFSGITSLYSNIKLRNAMITILNTSGQIVKTHLNVNGNIVNITAENIPKGFYFLNVYEKEKIRYTCKLIITD